MSGGAFDNIQYRYSDDFLSNSSLVDQVESMAKQLTTYGPEGKAAAAATQALHDRLVAMRKQIAEMEEEISKSLDPLQPVWKAVDYHYCNDWGPNEVQKALAEYNAPA